MIRVEIYEYHPSERHHEATVKISCRTLAGATIASRILLARREVVTTRGCYHRDVGRGAYAALLWGGRKPKTANAPVCIVPSVGELGVTP